MTVAESMGIVVELGLFMGDKAKEFFTPFFDKWTPGIDQESAHDFAKALAEYSLALIEHLDEDE